MIADYESRKIYKDAEWMLNSEIKYIEFEPDLHYFSWRLNTQIPKYISWKPDSYTYLTDAFSVH